METTNASQQPKFLCDEMLVGLARWLRAAGYDTSVCARGQNDRAILDLSIKEHRLLLTRDHKLSEFRNARDTVIWLDCNNIDTCVKELGKKITIDWMLAPFSRCMRCNTMLTAANPADISRVPLESQKLADPLMYCPSCDRVYWQGGHVERMRNKLQKWAAHTS